MNLELIFNTLKNSKKFSAIFVLNFCLGIFGIFALDYFRGVMDASLEQRARDFIGADLVMTSRFPIADAEKEKALAQLPATSAVFEGISLSSMASSDKRSRLVQVIKAGEGFPYYGGFWFADGSRFPQDDIALPGTDTVWAYPEILTQLELEVGDPIKIGQAYFRVSRIVEDDSYKAIRFSGYVPRVYMTDAAIARAGLIQFGSTARYSVNYLFRDSFSNDELEVIENDLEDVMGESIHARSPNDGSDRVTRMMRLVTDFLSLVSLVALFLSLVGLFYLYSGFLLKYKPDMQILLELGMRRANVVRTYLVHFFVLLLTATAIVFGLILLMNPFAEQLIGSQVKMTLVYRSDPWFFVRGLGLLAMVTPLIAWPMLTQTLSNTFAFSVRGLLPYLPLAGMLFGVSAYVADEPEFGLAFCAGVLGLVLLSLVVGYALLRWLDRPGLGGRISMALARKGITRKKPFALTVGVALFFATALFSVVPQVAFSLIASLELAEQDKPQLFLVDIQQHQIEGLQQLAAQQGTELQNLSPFIRARITAFNGVAYEDLSPEELADADKAREELRDRAVNLSYRGALYKTERIVAGDPFSGPYQDNDFSTSVELSIEERYAERRGLEVGDTLTFDVFGLEVPARIVNIRTVNWMDFLPNFFYLLQDGALNEAPKTFLATLPPGVYDSDQVILALADAFPNVTVVDVRYVIDKIIALVQSVTGVLYQLGLICVVIGLLIIAIIIQHQMALRQEDILRLKIIGVKLHQIRRAFLLEFAGLSLVATCAGLAVAMLASWGINFYLFEENWTPNWMLLWTTAVAVPALVLGIVSVFGYVVTQQKEMTPFGEE